MSIDVLSGAKQDKSIEGPNVGSRKLCRGNNWKNDKRKRKQTSMCRSVAPGNESITRDSTGDNGRCCGKDVPEAGV
jgi:hypothetical protein